MDRASVPTGKPSPSCHSTVHQSQALPAAAWRAPLWIWVSERRQMGTSVPSALMGNANPQRRSAPCSAPTSPLVCTCCSTAM